MRRIVLCLIIILTASSDLSYAETSDIWTKAQEGDAKSQATVGVWHLYGRADKEKNCDLAKEWFLKSARQGYEGAAVWLFVVYSGSYASCEENKEQSKDWLTVAEGRGIANYQWTLGEAYRDGWYGKPDIDKAMFWLQRAAQQGYADAERDLEKLLAKTTKK